MAGKKVSFGTKPQKQPDVDAWVESRDSPLETEERAVVEEQEPVKDEKVEGKVKAHPQKIEEAIELSVMKRLTLDIPESLHRRIKGRAVMEGTTMVNMLRELLEDTYG